MAADELQRKNIDKMYIERVSNQAIDQLIDQFEKSFRRKKENSLGLLIKNRIRFVGKKRGLEIHATSSSSNRPSAGLELEIKEIDELKNDQEPRKVAVHKAYSSTALKMDMVDSGWLNIPSYLMTVPKTSVKTWGITTKGYAANNKYSFNVSLSIPKKHLEEKTKTELERIREQSFREVKNVLRNLSVRLN